MPPETLLGQYIPLHYHYQMLLDEARMRGFTDAIAYSVPVDGRVLDLGGGTAVLSCMAARRAEKVWCVERQPDLADLARALVRRNGAADRVEVITADVNDFLPPEPVDIVICEMLHAALLREQQVAVIDAFKRRYLERFETLPRFLPEATILAVEPVTQDFDFFGFHAPIPLFEDPARPLEATRSLGTAVHYAIIDYAGQLPAEFQIHGRLAADRDGHCNALRFLTKNILAVVPERNGTIDWMNQNLILPLGEPRDLRAGDAFELSFRYRPGDEIAALQGSLVAG